MCRVATDWTRGIVSIMGGTIHRHREHLQISKSQSLIYTGLVGIQFNKWVTGGLPRDLANSNSVAGLAWNPQKRLDTIYIQCAFAGTRSSVTAVDNLVCGRLGHQVTSPKAEGLAISSVLSSIPAYSCVDNLKCHISLECGFQLQRRHR